MNGALRRRMDRIRARAALLLSVSICESIRVTETTIGKWYDPISQRWIVPREIRPAAAHLQSSEQKLLETCKSGDTRAEAQRIWDLLVDCCAD